MSTPTKPTHAGAAAEPVVLDRYAEVDHGGMRWHKQGEWVRYEDVAALTSAQADKADAFNRRLRAQLMQEWADLQRLKKAYAAPAETPPSGGTRCRSGGE